MASITPSKDPRKRSAQSPSQGSSPTKAPRNNDSSTGKDNGPTQEGNVPPPSSTTNGADEDNDKFRPLTLPSLACFDFVPCNWISSYSEFHTKMELLTAQDSDKATAIKNTSWYLLIQELRRMLVSGGCRIHPSIKQTARARIAEELALDDDAIQSAVTALQALINDATVVEKPPDSGPKRSASAWTAEVAAVSEVVDAVEKKSDVEEVTAEEILNHVAHHPLLCQSKHRNVKDRIAVMSVYVTFYPRHVE